MIKLYKLVVLAIFFSAVFGTNNSLFGQSTNSNVKGR